MKKIISALLALALAVSLAACSKAAGNESGSEDITNYTAGENSGESEKMLVLYFGSDNTADADLKSEATPYYDGVGATGYLAQHIAEKTGADIEKITPVTDYPSGYNDTVEAAKEEQNNSVYPEFQPLTHNPEDYDVIIIGYPVWWYKMPNIMDSFFNAYDLSGKVIIPFNTHEGSGDSGTYDDIRELEPNATVADGFNVKGSDAGEAEKDLDKWLEVMELV